MAPQAQYLVRTKYVIGHNQTNFVLRGASS